jgi:thiamine phosphate synthase YjbQ (UPF0047 family)
LEITTNEGASLSDVTLEVNAYVRTSGVRSGLCILSAASEDACLTLSADLDEDVDDLLRLARTQLSGAPAPDDRSGDDFGSAERSDRIDVDGGGYAPAGILADTISLPVREGAVGLGSWDAIVLLDAKGPAVRAIDVTIIGPSTL